MPRATYSRSTYPAPARSGPGRADSSPDSPGGSSSKRGHWSRAALWALAMVSSTSELSLAPLGQPA